MMEKIKKQKFRLRIKSTIVKGFIVDKPIFSLNKFTAGCEAGEHMPRWCLNFGLAQYEVLVTKYRKKSNCGDDTNHNSSINSNIRNKGNRVYR